AHARRAAEVLGSLEPVSDWSEASKHLLTGLGERLEARDDRGAKECRAAFDLVTRADDAALQARLGAECALALALAQSDISQPGKARETLDSVRGKPPFVTDTGLDRFWQLALADAWMRVGLTEAARLEAGPLRNAAATRALARHEELAAGGDRALRNASLARVGLACTPTMSYADLPGLAGVAWVMRQREQNVPGAALMPLLTQVAGRADVQPHWRADAALIAAEIARDADDVEAAADWYLQAAHLEPDPATSESLLLEALSWVTAQASAPEQVVIRVLRALDASSITTRDVDRWRIHLAQLLVRRYAQGDPEATRADVLEAAAVLGRVSERSSARDDAATMRATVWRVALQVATGRGAEGGGTVPPAERFEIEFAAERLLEAAVTPTSQPWRLEALVALQRYDEVLAEAASRPPMSLEGLESEFEAAWGADRIDLLPDLAERIGAHGPGAARVIRTIADDLWAQIEPRTRFMLDVEPAGATDRALLQAMTAVREYCVASWPAALPVQTDRLAWTQLVSGDATGAGATFTGLIDAQGARRGWLLGVGEAAFRAGDASSAFEAFRRVAQACESSDQQERDYWHAWVRMLQILDARGGQAERIRREVERLAWLDSAQAYDAYLQRARQLVR
ncbi:MAG: hypothetical protein KDA21_07355, partial [Phycisphaerales bacterium]|nr:hypothetical protein [Phycisphaerales bacterium]